MKKFIWTLSLKRIWRAYWRSLNIWGYSFRRVDSIVLPLDLFQMVLLPVIQSPPDRHKEHGPNSNVNVKWESINNNQLSKVGCADLEYRSPEQTPLSDTCWKYTLCHNVREEILICYLTKVMIWFSIIEICLSISSFIVYPWIILRIGNIPARTFKGDSSPRRGWVPWRKT